MESLPKKIKNRINKELTSMSMNTYHFEIPIHEMFTILEKHGVAVLNEDGTKFEGFFIGSEGRAILNLGMKKNKGFTMSSTNFVLTWYKMPSGKFEIVSYVS